MRTDLRLHLSSIDPRHSSGGRTLVSSTNVSNYTSVVAKGGKRTANGEAEESPTHMVGKHARSAVAYTDRNSRLRTTRTETDPAPLVLDCVEQKAENGSTSAVSTDKM